MKRYLKTYIQKKDDMVPLFRTFEFDVQSQMTVCEDYGFYKKHVNKTLSADAGDTEDFEVERLLDSKDWEETSQADLIAEIDGREVRTIA